MSTLSDGGKAEILIDVLWLDDEKSDESRKTNEGHASSEARQADRKSGPEIGRSSLQLVLEWIKHIAIFQHERQLVYPSKHN